MKQYCRYCLNAVLTENEEIVYCDSKHKTEHKNSCIRINKCKHFDFCELDVFDSDKKYKPRKVKNKVLDNQLKLNI